MKCDANKAINMFNNVFSPTLFCTCCYAIRQCKATRAVSCKGRVRPWSNPCTFQNALENGSKQNCILIFLVWTVESVSKWKRWRHYTTWVNTRHAHIVKMTSRHVYQRFVDGWIRHENDSVSKNAECRKMLLAILSKPCTSRKSFKTLLASTFFYLKLYKGMNQWTKLFWDLMQQKFDMRT